MTMWAAHALGRFGEIVNYNGDRVEQSSSLASVLLLALLEKLTPWSLPTLAVLVSVAAGCLTVWLTQKLAQQVDRDSSLAAGWLTASAVHLVYWSFGGLETTLAAFGYTSVALASVQVLRDGWTTSALVGALAALLLALTTRPEAMFVLVTALSALVGFLALRRLPLRAETDVPDPTIRRAYWLLLAVGIISAALLLWRHAYFDAWFPQPVIAKSRGLSKSAVVDGLSYLMMRGWARIDGGVWILALPATLYLTIRWCRSQSADAAVLIAPIFTGVGFLFVVTSGGDWMEGGRFLVPILPTAVISVVTALRLWAPRRAGMAVAALLVLQLTGTLSFARTDSSGGPAWAVAHINPREIAGASWFEQLQRIHYRDLVCSRRLTDVIAKVRARTGRRVTVMSTQMGLLAFRAAVSAFGEVRFLDRAGLVTRDFTQCPATSYLPHSAAGVAVTYSFFFAAHDRLRGLCAIDNPDIVYEVSLGDWRNARAVEANGYRIVYLQDGLITNGSRWFGGQAIRGGEFIAVRRDLSEGLNYPTVSFSQDGTIKADE